jgi:hypothetical protein
VPVFAAAMALDGCWTAPIATVQPRGEPRLIQDAVAVESVKNPAIVQSVDASTRTVVVLNPTNLALTVYKAGPRVSNFDQIRAGDKVRATVAEELTVFVLKNGQMSAESGKVNLTEADAKVLMVDPSYRLLTLQYPDGHTETFKVGLDVKLQRMEPGDDVVVRAVETVALQVQAP